MHAFEQPARTRDKTVVPRMFHRAAADRAAADRVLRSSGQPVATPLRQEMEARLGADFSQVRVHTDSAAHASAAQFGARAYTVGDHVVLGDGGADKYILAHELIHVIQQRQGPVSGTDHGSGLRFSDPSDQFERAAEATAGRALRGAPSGVAHLQPLAGNTAVTQLPSGQPGRQRTPAVVQRVMVGEMKQGLGSELLHKHVGTEPMPRLDTPDQREQAVAAVYYQRTKDDRRPKNTVFFAAPATLFDDLKETNKEKDLGPNENYTTTRPYPAITVLVAGTQYRKPSGEQVQGAVTGPFHKLTIEYGPAKPVVKINRDDGPYAFNHLQQTDPKQLVNQVDLLKPED
jgi:Domain of unknown function (DUF4157)